MDYVSLSGSVMCVVYICVIVDNKICINNNGTSTLESLGLSHDLNYWISD